MTHEGLVLGIETSCDETAAAVVTRENRVLSNVIATQDELHRRYAGVVPEIASRAHLERIVPVVEEALRIAGADLADLAAIAVGNRPGLIGSLLVGVSAAKALAWSLSIPIIGVDHVHAHLVAGLLDRDELPPFPALGLVVSGGHTAIFRLDEPLSAQLLGRTIDDAVGEAFDKAATILGLGWPGGPAIDRLARRGNDRAHDFPVASLAHNGLDFSFSGLKTALLYAACGTPARGERGGAARYATAPPLAEAARENLAASFERAAVRAIVRALERALEQVDASTLLAGGGVTANTRLRAELIALAEEHGLVLCLPPVEHCLDNAAMIAAVGAMRLERADVDDLTLAAASRGAWA